MKLQKKNANGKVIIKDIPENLVATYKQIGWKDVVVKADFKPKDDEKTRSSEKTVLDDVIKRND